MRKFCAVNRLCSERVVIAPEVKGQRIYNYIRYNWLLKYNDVIQSLALRNRQLHVAVTLGCVTEAQ